MKSLFLATAAVAAFAAAPAFAQDSVGSIGVKYSNTDIEFAGLSGEAETASVDAGIAIPVTSAWTVTVDGGFQLAIDGADDVDDSSTNGRVHVSRNFGNVRVGAFAGGAEAVDEQLWSFGAEAQAYMNDKITLTGVVAYETVESTDADIWSVGGDASYFVSPTFRLNAGAGWSTADLGAGVDGDGWSANVGGEYQFPGTGISVAAGYVRSEIEDLDLQADTINVGLRFSFGGDLQTRQRSGADLGRTVSGVGSLLGAL
ncbi:MAG: outer membrane beta-barrel protein [Brevundimonas sp.]